MTKQLYVDRTELEGKMGSFIKYRTMDRDTKQNITLSQLPVTELDRIFQKMHKLWGSSDYRMLEGAMVPIRVFGLFTDDLTHNGVYLLCHKYDQSIELPGGMIDRDIIEGSSSSVQICYETIVQSMQKSLYTSTPYTISDASIGKHQFAEDTMIHLLAREGFKVGPLNNTGVYILYDKTGLNIFVHVDLYYKSMYASRSIVFYNSVECRVSKRYDKLDDKRRYLNSPGSFDMRIDDPDCDMFPYIFGTKEIFG